MEKDKNWPAWRYGPNGHAAMFERSEDVPSDWRDHPTKVGEKAAAPVKTPTPTPTPTPAPDARIGDTAPSGDGAPVELDTAGWPWMAVLHARSKGKTKDGLWRMKVGVSRPDPKPGYPLDL